MNDLDLSSLSRTIQPMSDFVRDALVKNNLLNLYNNRPPYQRNDYLGWINRAKRSATKDKRLKQMLYELKHGGLYMKMKYRSPNPES